LARLFSVYEIIQIRTEPYLSYFGIELHISRFVVFSSFFILSSVALKYLALKTAAAEHRTSGSHPVISFWKKICS
jgi:hypothetical protein